jgi:gliding motility-associated-like protein
LKTPLFFSLFFCFSQVFGQSLVVNEFTNGPSGSKEYIEFIVVDNTAPYNCTLDEPPCIDIRGWIIDDNNGYHGTGGIASGCNRFSMNDIWSCVPLGTIIVIYNNADLHPNMPADDLDMNDGNCTIIAPINNTTLFDRNLTTPGDVACDYPSAGWNAGGNWTYIGMRNDGDCVRLVDLSGCEVFSLCYGDVNQNTQIYFSGSGLHRVYYFNGDDPYSQANWTNGCAGGTSCTGNEQTPGAPNNTANSEYIYQFNNNCQPITLLEVTSTFVDSDCNCSGSISLNASGSISGYTYAWSNGETTSTINNLCGNIYSYTVTSHIGCTVTESVTISEAVPPNASVTNITHESCVNFNDGTIQINASNGTPGYNVSWSGASSGNPAGTEIAASGGSYTITGLNPGAYTVSVTDAASCLTVVNTTIDPGIIITPNIAPLGTNQCLQGNSFSFNGSGSTISSGSITSYTWNFGDGNNGSGATTTHTYATAGNFTVTLTVSDGTCSNQTTASLVVYPNPTVVLTPTNPTCAGFNNGAILATPAGGTATYSYNWSSGASGTGASHTATGLLAGTYTLTVQDANLCPVTATATLVDPSLITVTTSVTNPSCAGLNDGTATVSATGGAGGYTYAWSNFQNTTTATGLLANTFNVTVTDANLCTTVTNATLVDPSFITVTPTILDASCGNADGSVSVVATGGAGGYSYAWSNSVGNTANNTNVAAGNYTVTVSDANGCTEVETFSVADAGSPGITITNVVSVTCYGGNNGSAEVLVSGGTPPYSLLWSNGQTTNTANGLVAGNHSITITDASIPSNCVATASVEILQPALLESFITGTVNPTCLGGNNGSATITGSGGTPTYTYAWSSGSNVATATGLSAGTYSVTVTDNNNCTVTNTTNLTQPTQVSVTPSSTSITCNGLSNGTASATGSGGSGAGYMFVWSNGTTAASISSLSAGNYTVTAYDSNNCPSNGASVEVVQPDLLEVTAVCTNVSIPNAGDGSSEAAASGGTPTYTYLWSTGGTTAIITGLSGSINTVTVTDANGCTATANCEVFEATCNVTPTIDVTNISCNGANNGTATAGLLGGATPLTFLWSNGAPNNATASNLGVGTISVTITDNTNCTAQTSGTITQPSAISVSGTTVNTTCFGSSDGSINITASGGTGTLSYNWSSGQNSEDISGIPAGNYTVSVTDDNGCLATTSATITQPTLLTATTSKIDIDCGGKNLTGEATVTPSGGTTGYTYLWNDPLNQTGATATNLPAGGYSVTVTDLFGCEVRTNVTITEPPAITLTPSTTSSTCNQNDGEACVTATGGTGTLSYLWNNGHTSPCTSNQFAGSYNVTVTDDNGCSEITPVVISNTSGPSISIASFTNVSCFGGSNGAAVSNTVGGESTLSYQWYDQFNNPITGLVSPNASNLFAGIYSVEVEDANGCSVFAMVTITEPTEIQYNPAFNNPTCFGAGDGTASATVIGGTTPYTTSWFPGGQSGLSISGLDGGNYTLNLTDANGCIVNIDYTLVEPLQITSDPVAVSDVTCFNACNGSASFTVYDAIAPVTYSWSNGQNGQTINNICAGNYSVTATDLNGCQVSRSFVVNEPLELIASIDNFGDLSCYQSCDGYIQAAVTGGTPPYNFLWTGGQIAQVATNLCANNYTLTVTDDNGCASVISQLVSEPTELVAAINSKQDVTCFDACNGSATVSVSGSTAPYFYLWDNLQQTPTATNLCAANNIRVTVSDATGNCVTTASVNITQPAAISTVVNTTNANCGQANGQICVSLSGGTAPFSYFWSNPALPQLSCANNIVAGCYTVDIVDANNCTLSELVCIDDIEGPSISYLNHQDVTCFGNSDGLINYNVSGGVSPYVYRWYQPVNVLMPAFNGSTTALLLAGGKSYYMEVTDNAGCVATRSQFIAQPPEIISAITSKINVSCFDGNDGRAVIMAGGGVPGYTYLWNTTPQQTSSTATALSAGVYTCIVTDVNGCMDNTPASVTITQPSELSIASTVVQPNCFGDCNGSVNISASGATPPYYYLWSNSTSQNPLATNLCDGVYQVTVKDAYACQSVVSENIVQPAQLTANISVTDAFCTAFNGTASIYNVAGGTGTYSYDWHTGATTPTAYNLYLGNYTAYLYDENNCSINLPFTIGNSPSPVISTLSFTSPGCSGGNDGSATVNFSGGTAPFSFLWSGPIIGNAPTTQTATGLTAGNYCVIVTDANGCSAVKCGVLTDPATFNVNIIASATTLCAGQSAQIWANPAGGSTPYPTISCDQAIWGGAGNGLCGYGGHIITPPANSIRDYSVTVTDAKGCVASNTISITTLPELVVNTPDSVFTCLGTPAVVCADGYGGSATSNYTFTWSNGYSSSGEATSCQTVNETSSTQYRVILSDGCSKNDTAFINMIVYPLPVPAYAALNNVGCPPLTTSFSATSSLPNSSFSWDVDGNGTEDDTTAVFDWTYENTGTYDVILKVTSEDGCVTTVPIYQYITVYPRPVAKIILDPINPSLLNALVTHDASQTIGADSLLFWKFYDGTSHEGMSYEKMYQDTGSFPVVLTAWNQYQCFDIDTQIVKINPDFVIYVPNAFTPDFDNNNDIFIPKGVGIDVNNFEMIIFDRWGQIIFETTDFYQGWDGSVKGSSTIAPQGVYVWKITVKDITDAQQTHRLVGHVTLLK